MSTSRTLVTRTTVCIVAALLASLDWVTAYALPNTSSAFASTTSLELPSLQSTAASIPQIQPRELITVCIPSLTLSLCIPELSFSLQASTSKTTVPQSTANSGTSRTTVPAPISTFSASSLTFTSPSLPSSVSEPTSYSSAPSSSRDDFSSSTNIASDQTNEPSSTSTIMNAWSSSILSLHSDISPSSGRLSTDASGYSPTPASAAATSTHSTVHIWVVVLIIASTLLLVVIAGSAVWLYQKRRGRNQARGSPLSADLNSEEDLISFSKPSEASSHLNVGFIQQHIDIPDTHGVGDREPCGAALDGQTRNSTTDTVETEDICSFLDCPADGLSRSPTRPSGRPTLRLSIKSLDPYVSHSDAIPSSTTWQSPQLSVRNVSPTLAVRPQSKVLVLGRLSWHSALTPRTTTPRDLPPWPARPALHTRPRGPRSRTDCSTQVLDCREEEDVTDTLKDPIVASSRRRAEDGGVRLAGGPVPSAEPSSAGDGRASSDSRGGSSEITLPPAYAMY